MDTIEKISVVIPKFKYQLTFLKEREKLLTIHSDLTNDSVDLSSTSSSLLSMDVSSSGQDVSDDKKTHSQPLIEDKRGDFFPDQYVIPPLPNSLLNDISNGSLNKFGPHFGNRQILIDAIVHDLIDRHKLL